MSSQTLLAQHVRRKSAAARRLSLWIRLPPGFCLLWVLCVVGRGLCNELITRPEESYLLCCVFVCDRVTSRMRPWPALGYSATGKKMLSPNCPVAKLDHHCSKSWSTTSKRWKLKDAFVPRWNTFIYSNLSNILKLMLHICRPFLKWSHCCPHLKTTNLLSESHSVIISQYKAIEINYYLICLFVIFSRSP